MTRAFSLLSCLRQGAQFVVPFRLKGIGDQAIGRIDQHESTLRQIGFELRALDGSAAQPDRGRAMAGPGSNGHCTEPHSVRAVFDSGSAPGRRAAPLSRQA